MIKFQWPYLALLLPLPIILLFIYKLKKHFLQQNPNVNNGLLIPFYDDLLNNKNLNIHKSTTNIFNFVNLLKMIIWILFIVALMRPVWLGKPISLPIPTHDIIMAIDISGSMQAEDMSEQYRQTRLDVVKQIAKQFIEMRSSDRIGLVFFGSQAFVSSPLTLDKKSLQSFLQKTQIGFAGPKTAIGDALGLAIKRLKIGNETLNTKFIILLSDGSNTSGSVDPLNVAKIAANNKIKIYTIGIGQTSNNIFDIQSGMDLDEETLKNIANLTDGVYFHATSSKKLAKIYQEINALEPNLSEAKIMRPETEWFIYPALAAFILSLILGLMNTRINNL
jgi:Ca-activated chloride channel family protein